jgi:hypothetical protein
MSVIYITDKGLISNLSENTSYIPTRKRQSGRNKGEVKRYFKYGRNTNGHKKKICYLIIRKMNLKNNEISLHTLNKRLILNRLTTTADSVE